MGHCFSCHERVIKLRADPSRVARGVALGCPPRVSWFPSGGVSSWVWVLGHPGTFDSLERLLVWCPRAAPRLRLQGPHTTSMSCRRIGRPFFRRSQASGLWSAWRSVVAPQSVQNGWSRRACSDSLRHRWSYPRSRAVVFGAVVVPAARMRLYLAVHSGHLAPLVVGVPQLRQGLVMFIGLSSPRCPQGGWLGQGLLPR